jgi:HAD superfamily hydrolase (TIGR01484 family)
MIAIDIDGTLLPSTGVVVSRRNCQALREAEAAGIEIVIATGRRQAYAAPLHRSGWVEARDSVHHIEWDGDAHLGRGAD